MKESCPFTALLWLLLSLNVVVQSTASEMKYLPAPTNITVTPVSMGKITLRWALAANCSPDYYITISSPHFSMKFEKCTTRTVSEFNINRVWNLFELNNFSTAIQAKCSGMESEWTKKSHMHWLVPDNKETWVRNISCVWHYMEDIKCTWQPIEGTPDVQYRLFYWYWNPDQFSETDPIYTRFSESAQLEDKLRTGTECRDYFSDGSYSGCKFQYNHSFSDTYNLLFGVTDTLYSMKPFLYYIEARNIAKLKSPNITYVSKDINNVLHINWTASPLERSLTFEVHVSSDSWKEPIMSNTDVLQASITIPATDDTLKVKVRAQFSKLGGDYLFWSDWSEESIVPGKNKDRTSILLLTLIPAAVIVLVVILLVYLKRLKILILPPIPQPRKMFQNDLQLWLKSDRPVNVHDNPDKEEVSPVSLLELKTNSSFDVE